MTWETSKILGVNPLEALGYDGIMTPEAQMFVIEMGRPEVAAEIQEDREAARIAADLFKRDRWEMALPGGNGYRGLRGGTEPKPIAQRVVRYKNKIARALDNGAVIQRVTSDRPPENAQQKKAVRKARPKQRGANGRSQG